MKQRLETGPTEVKIRASKLWVSADGMFAVVYAVYPRGLVRSLTRKTVEKAKGVPKIELVARPAMLHAGFALVPVRYIMEEENDWGEVAP